jgi:PAS domain S-box-containing protein
MPAFTLAELPVPAVYATHRIIRDCNEAFAELFASSRDDIVDRSFARLYPQIEDFIHRGEQWAVNFSGHRAYRDERVMARLNGERFWCRVSGRSLATTADPFERALYCFEPIARPVGHAGMQLTERQEQILAQLAQGKTSAEIATELDLSPRTIEAHRARLMKSLVLRNTAELMHWFLQGGPGAAGFAETPHGPNTLHHPLSRHPRA